MAVILEAARSIPVIRWRPTAAQLRLASGLVLFAFASTHFLNHAAGLVSIDLMESVRDIRTAVTRSAPGTIILLAAAITHFVLGVWRFLKRRTLRVRPNEWVQLAFGLLIPLLLLRHIIGTRIVHEAYGCNGLHHWLMLKSWYQRSRWLWNGLAVLIPALGFAGFATAGRAARFETDFDNPFTPEQIELFYGIMDRALYGYIALLVMLIGARIALTLADR